MLNGGALVRAEYIGQTILLTRTAAASSFGLVKCARCGCDNPQDLRFCRDCGCKLALDPSILDIQNPAGSQAADGSIGPHLRVSSGLPATRACPQCGAAATPRHAFCTECGAVLASLAISKSDSGPTAIFPTWTDSAISDLATSDRREAGFDERGSSRACERCGAQSPDTAAFCVACGESIVRSDDKSVDLPNFDSPTLSQSKPALEQCESSNGPRLVAVAPDGSRSQTYPLDATTIDIGRSEGNIVLAHDRYVCPRHARVSSDGRSLIVQDLGSVNGVFVQLHEPTPLRDGDTLLLGLVVLTFNLAGPGEQSLGPAEDRGTLVFGSPGAPRYARLTEKTTEGAVRDVYVIGREETILGREVGDIVFTGDPFMSRRHAAIVRDTSSGQFTVQDLGSSNGTFLRIHGRAELPAGDHMRIGQHVFRFEVENG